MLRIKVVGLDPTIRYALSLEGKFKRARRSALASTGFFMAGKVKDYMEQGGQGWPVVHPMTKRFWHRYTTKWRGRRTYRGAGFKLAKFTRYLVDKRATKVEVSFGKSRRGEPGQFDSALSRLIWSFQVGRREKVTRTMRRYFGAQKGKRRKKIGLSFFPLSKDLKEIVVPRRPVIIPVHAKEFRSSVRVFNTKFFEALRRYKAI